MSDIRLSYKKLARATDLGWQSGCLVKLSVDARAPAPSQNAKLAASLAHEISNPVDALLNLLYLLKTEAPFTGKQKEYFDLICFEAEQLRTIAHRALEDYRRAEASSVTSLPNLVESVLQSYAARLASRRIVVHTRFCLGGMISIHASTLRQCVVSLLLNAADAMPSGGTVHARVSESSERSGLQRRGWRITIADTGCGIPLENLRRVFQPFFTTKSSHGNGIGLSMAKDFVCQHEGVLRFRTSTRAGHSGTVFCIFLPQRGLSAVDLPHAPVTFVG